MAMPEFLNLSIKEAHLPYGGVLYEMCAPDSAFNATLAEKMQLLGAAYNLSPFSDQCGKALSNLKILQLLRQRAKCIWTP